MNDWDLETINAHIAMRNEEQPPREERDPDEEADRVADDAWERRQERLRLAQLPSNNNATGHMF